MMHSEAQLARLDKFEEANTLRRRVKLVKPKEIAKHKAHIEHKFTTMREKLAARHDFEMRKLDEKLHDMRLRTTRRCTHGDDVMRLRLRHHQTDMHHKHTLATNQVRCIRYDTIVNTINHVVVCGHAGIAVDEPAVRDEI
jgi:hypothetical protein